MHDDSGTSQDIGRRTGWGADTTFNLWVMGGTLCNLWGSDKTGIGTILNIFAHVQKIQTSDDY